MIFEAVDHNANIIFGTSVDHSMNGSGEIAITVIATGFPLALTEISLSATAGGKIHAECEECRNRLFYLCPAIVVVTH